jgi:hypothetical protein
MTALTPDVGTPVSEKIRERLTAARKRYHANDNIAAFIEPGELEKLLDCKVFIEMWVKVRSGWADDEARVRSFGYE